MSAGVCGSVLYIAPEEYMDKEFDPRAVDVWACEVIYMAMRTRQYMWQLARVSKYRSSSDMLKTATQQRATSQSRV